MTAATVYRIVVPGVPDPELSPNARVHRMVKARKVRQWRETAGWAAKAAAPVRPAGGGCVMEFAGWLVAAIILVAWISIGCEED